MENYLDQLNEQQRDAVTYIEGTQLVIAGAGSGKTRVLTSKIVHLLNQGFEPWRLLVLTFTNKAAREMIDRIGAMLGSNTVNAMWAGTFHSVFARMLRAHADRLGYRNDFTIYDTADTKALIKIIVKEMALNDKIYTPTAVYRAISSAKNALISPARYAESANIRRADEAARRPRMYEVYAMYVERCKAASAMDFDDLLYNMNVLLRDHDDVRLHYQKYFRYVLVDEYQDTNFAQHMIVKQLTGDNHNLCVVGDDAQSIYSFRGANISNILEMSRFYPDLKVFKLEQNYRSTQNIINAANSLIACNKDQIRKEIFSKNEIGEKLAVLKCRDDAEESREVASAIFRRHHSTGDSLNEFAVLYRTNAQSRMFEEELRNRNIPYRIWGGMSFYQRKEVKDALAYFRLTVNPDDDEALRRAVAYPSRGIGDTTMKRLTDAAIAAGVSIWTVISNPEKYDTGLKSAALKRLAQFRAVIQKNIDMNASGSYTAVELAEAVLEGSGIPDLLKSENTPENISRRDNLAELLNSVRQVEESMGYVVPDNQDTPGQRQVTESGLAAFLSRASLATDQDQRQSEADVDRVTLMTVHAAKGLEFNHIYIVGVEDDFFPSSMSKDSESKIEEERRLMYVAITRARKSCMLTYARRRYRNGQAVYPVVSPFLKEINSKYLSGNVSALTRDINNFRNTGQHAGKISVPNMPPPPPAPRAYTPQSNMSPQSAPASSFTTHAAGELHPGMIINHIRFGRGRITNTDPNTLGNDRVTVLFESDSSPKTLMLAFAKFEILE